MNTTPDASIYDDSALQQQMQEKFLGTDVDQYGSDYLRIKNAQYAYQKGTICSLYTVITIIMVESLFLMISDVIQFIGYNDDTLCTVKGFE